MSRCPNKEICGSCSWSHIPYKKQLTQKLSDINGSFKLKELDLRCEEIWPSPKTEHYRNRMDFVIDFQGRVGMREKNKWWKVIDRHTCFLADERIEELFTQVCAWVNTCGLSYYDRKAHTGFLRYAVIRATSKGQTMLNLVTSPPIGKEEEHIKFAYEHFMSLTTLIWSINDTITDVSFGADVRVVHGNGWIEEMIDGNRYRISPNAFFQTNSFAAPLLLETVRTFAGELREKRVLDLYCGTGFFAVDFAKTAKDVVGFEMVEDAIADARINADLNQRTVEFFAAKTEETDWSVYKPDLVILDPPRSGMHDTALADVLRIQPQEIVYVSCNPKNFAREMVQLQQTYHVEHMRAVDMFPHTPHVELVSKLVKKL